MARARAGIALLTESGISSIMARVSARRGGPGEKTRKRGSRESGFRVFGYGQKGQTLEYL